MEFDAGPGAARINGLRLRPVQTPLVRQIGRAADLLAKAAEGGEPASRALYVFSDRTATSWDADEAKRLKVPEGVDVAYIDLGVDEPRDLAIDSVDVKPRVVDAGGEVTVHAEVRAVGADFDANLLCQLDNEASPASQHVKLSGASKTPVGFDFKLKAPTPVRPPGTPEGVYEEPHQIVVKFATPDDRPFKDDLPHDNIRYATFLVRDDPKRQGRQVLTLADAPESARFWKAALQAYQVYHPDGGFRCDVRPAGRRGEARRQGAAAVSRGLPVPAGEAVARRFLTALDKLCQRRRRFGHRTAGRGPRRPSQRLERRRRRFAAGAAGGVEDRPGGKILLLGRIRPQ